MRPAQVRIDSAVRYMRRFLASPDGAGFTDLPVNAQILYIVGLLICDDAGHISKERLDDATGDEEVEYAAKIVASRVGLLGRPTPSFDRYA
jgi:hypothetical protein